MGQVSYGAEGEIDCSGKEVNAVYGKGVYEMESRVDEEFYTRVACILVLIEHFIKMGSLHLVA